jgi:hypothetical protein
MQQERAGGGRAFDDWRFFCADDELIHVEGRTYAFTNQWGTDSFLAAIDNLSNAFPEHGIAYKKSEDET